MAFKRLGTKYIFSAEKTSKINFATIFPHELYKVVNIRREHKLPFFTEKHMGYIRINCSKSGWIQIWASKEQIKAWLTPQAYKKALKLAGMEE